MKILSWNAQGYDGQVEKFVFIRTLLNTGEYDLICIQEAGHVLGSFDQSVFGTNYPIVYQQKENSESRSVNHLQEYYAIYYEWGSKNKRCSLVTYVKKCLYSESSVYIPPMIRNIRGGLITTINTVYGLVNVCNIHLQSGDPDFAWQQFQEILVNMQGATYPFIIIGDFNIDAIRSQPFISPQNHFYPIIINNQIIITQKSGGCLDYAYSEIYPPSEYGILATPGNLSDHAPVFYIFKMQV